METVLRGARVVDGSGGPARAADVGIASGRIAAVGDVDPDGADVVDLGGLVLAPGFVDIHTHYDAQVLWDPDFTPSSWHGVTTVVVGNCGFGIAPTRPEHHDMIIRTLENVEGMAAEALEAGITWSFETFPEYLDALERLPKRCNMGVLVGHTPVRLYVLGDESTEREATADEVARMRAIVAEALRAGAVGFATSASPTHLGAAGRPVPSRLATLDEIKALAGAMTEVGRGVMQATAGPLLFHQQFADIARETGRPVSWTAILTGMFPRGTAQKLVDGTAGAGGEVWPQIACRPLVMQITLADPFPLGTVPAFQEVMAAPREQRAALYADPAWRDRARGTVGNLWGNRFASTTVQETRIHAELRNGPTLTELAAQRGVDPFDLLVDLALEEDLETRFRIVLSNDDDDELAVLLGDGRFLLGLSDAGAHASQLCDANFATHLLQHWHRERGVLTLEQAVWRLTSHPAHVFRLDGRGLIRDGYVADLVAFDPETVGTDDLERVHDLPGGADRLVARSRGIEHVWVGGVPTRRAGRDLDDARPGVLIRGGGP